jgi:hypothetical protein
LAYDQPHIPEEISMTKRTACAVAVLVLLAPLTMVAQKRKSEPIRREAEIMLRLIEASSAAKPANDASQLVPAELKSILNFRSYHLLDSAFIRGQEGRKLEITLADSLKGELRFDVQGDSNAGLLRVEVDLLGPPKESGSRSRLLETRTTVKSGEAVVLGASRMRSGDKALIVLLTARLLP